MPGAHSDPSTAVSPKVTWGTAAALGAAIVLSVISALVADPSGLGFELPQWADFLLTTVGPVLVGFGTAYMKTDPLRSSIEQA